MPLETPGFLSYSGPAKVGKIEEFPVFSQFNSEIRPETGSQQTAPSANQSVHLAYISEKAETLREMRRSFHPRRTGESRPAPDSLDSASILSGQNRNGSL
jgi:hypothetical protein